MTALPHDRIDLSDHGVIHIRSPLTASPDDTARTLAMDRAPGDHFVIIRRIKVYTDPSIPFRWDATEWTVHVPPDPPVTAHDRIGKHACMTRVGFGFTRRGALLGLRRARRSR